MKTKPTNPDYLNGVPELLLLQLLAQHPRHGYDLVRAITLQTGAKLEFGEGCIYPILHRLERKGLLASKSEAVGNRQRIVYRVTARGQKQLVASRQSWQQVVDAEQGILEGGHHADATVA